MRKTKPVILTEMQMRALEKIGASDAQYVIGVDEVGLGSWAGPVVVAAAVLPREWKHSEVTDSKKLSPKKREKADAIVREAVLMHCIFSGDNLEVDARGVHRMREALTVQASMKCLEYFPDALVVQDGDLPILLSGSPPPRLVWLPKADLLVQAVSAASILAKVYRDHFMKEQAKLYPGYGFETNVGYGSKKHSEGLEKLGVCPLHRLSYKPIRRYIRDKALVSSMKDALPS